MKTSYAIILFIFIFSLLSSSVNQMDIFQTDAIETGITDDDITLINSSAEDSLSVGDMDSEENAFSVFSGVQMIINSANVLFSAIGNTLIVMPTLLKYGVPVPVALLFQLVVSYIEANAIIEFLSGRRVTQ